MHHSNIRETHIYKNEYTTFDKSSSLNPRKVFVVKTKKKRNIPESPETFHNINEKNCFQFFVVYCCVVRDLKMFFFLIYFGSIAKIYKSI